LLNEFGIGLVVGKMYPPTLGHQHLVQSALDRCDAVVVLITDTPVPGWNIPVGQRVEWLNQIFVGQDNLVIKSIPDLNIDDSRPESHKYWAEYTEAILGILPDAVFSSETYGEPWAEAMGAKHVLVDLERTTVPISGTRVRTDIGYALDYLHPVVRSYFVPRVVLVGAESTGTTTLSNALAEYFEEPVVEEYGRRVQMEATDAGKPILPDEWTLDLFKTIAHVQDAEEDGLAEDAGRLLICDTDSLATALWWEYYGNVPSQELWNIGTARMHRPNRIYIITDKEGVPFEDDGYRENLKRDWMDEKFKQVLTALNVPHIVVTGSKDERLLQAVAFIEGKFHAVQAS
jgi:HTH-type transcriptional repressor of NAD biosynthesis genes